MSRLIMCRKLKEELPGLDMPPFPGPKGEEIFNTISKNAWADWMAHQTTLINELRLNMMDTSARSYLAEQREKFFNGKNLTRLRDTFAPKQ